MMPKWQNVSSPEEIQKEYTFPFFIPAGAACLHELLIELANAINQLSEKEEAFRRRIYSFGLLKSR